ncbi:DNA-binding PadR family transcriptional regulator [Actinoalloteichus hoggarensis]|uniref:Transcriptional regulator PadR-like family protein n=1 Tax=Actinoalloteichus hoggarensis TaxID=1470176 RepID=A0A221W821_9PSEU|nr:PadR family transcriptional regulator [Actinoalloteichus hoggarensis]ASO22068.1 Transcriptional regulator PadR-like family protein [Actinoalloteichus hoggarensis]MBB5923850.1 DNA-binding PadR family transcriptional regulator [Actinoalloteichus hoggarensis]
MELTASELTVLGLIIERPQHGYDLERVIEQRGIRQWTDIGFSSIYYLLAKLERRGLLHVPEAPAAAKSRRVFHATAEGRAAAARTALALVTDLRPVAHPFLVGAANLPLLTEHEYAEALRTRLAQVEERIAAVRQAEQATVPLPSPAGEVFSYSLSLLQAERSWLASRVRVPDDEQD